MRRWTFAAGLVMALVVLPPSWGEEPATRQVIDVRVDPRFELISILFGLAGNREYGMGRVDAYTKEVERHFGMMREHPAVKLAARLRTTRGVSFDAPMSLAAQISDVPELKLLVPLDPWPAGLDSRWRAEDVTAFLDAARAFVKDSAFEAFVRDRHPLYSQVEQRMRSTLQRAHLEWFDAFFGKRPSARFHLVIGLLNGAGSYGTRRVTENGEELYCVLGVWNFDNHGIPTFPDSVLPTVIHEFCHSYVNSIVDAHRDALESAGTTLFARVRTQMQRQAYSNWQTVMRESMVRACVVRWRYANQGTAAGMAEVTEQWNRGFLWTAALSKTLAEYESQREKYPTLEPFMPEVVRCMNEYAGSELPASRPASQRN